MYKRTVTHKHAVNHTHISFDITAVVVHLRLYLKFKGGRNFVKGGKYPLCPPNEPLPRQLADHRRRALYNPRTTQFVHLQ